MNLNLTSWKRFRMGLLFDIKKGKRLTSEDQEDGDCIYIGAIDSNNGVANHISQKPIHSGNTISLSYNGSVGEAFYQPEDYWATDDVNALYSKYNGFNQYIGLFIVTVIRQEKYRFSYGRKWTLDNMNETEIALPVKHNSDGSVFIDNDKTYSEDGYIPDWQFMEDYIKSLHYKPITTNNSKCCLNLNIEEWKFFKIGDIFECDTTPLSIKDDLGEGSTPLISRTANNNGCDGYFSVDEDAISEGNCITVGAEGIYAFYQPQKFCSGNKVYTLRNHNLNKSNAIFVCTILNKEDYRYSYGRARILSKLKDEIIKLPSITNDDGTYSPDWQFMEDYIKSLPYGDRI